MARCDNTASDHNMNTEALKWLQLLGIFDRHTDGKISIEHEDGGLCGSAKI